MTTNVDDLLMIGDEVFNKDVTEKLQKLFKFSKIEDKEFTYCGCKISQREDGSILLDQNEYIKDLTQIDRVEGCDERQLTREEKKVARGKRGAFL